jgi:acyl-CoA synthetase (AMP-forming)/AMP-acid ligase II
MMSIFRRGILPMLLAAVAVPAMAQERSITVASTTSTEQSGLFGHILPIFTRESGVAVLVAEAGATIDPAAVMAHLDGKLGRYKWPAKIVVWDALPRSGYGKVPKNEVKRLLNEREQA